MTSITMWLVIESEGWRRWSWEKANGGAEGGFIRARKAKFHQIHVRSGFSQIGLHVGF